MDTSFARLLLFSLAVPFLAESASAQGTLRRFDDLNFSALTAARDLRWEIHDEFARSRDQGHLLRDIDSLVGDLHQLQRMIYQRRSPQDLDRELDHALEHVSELKQHLLGCDFAFQQQGNYQGNANGYVFTPATQHGGRVHVDHAIQMLAGIEGNLAQLHRELVGLTQPVPYPTPNYPGVQVPVLPAPQPPVILQGQPTSWKHPPFYGKKGGIVIQVKK
ncbi:hypothetical protein [Planctomicrobium piriforme]|uniref:Uncharacterized protein n=1 Tax=Planctomicrobium piriforme TaxID=1576369 RepID=A0A1I3HUF3_9PLAN|nr:hypothetical protein [Planctomicrobium piriforme]SFI39292.1 hypothetical protein SAMN05421753_108196 [Planctomicrobium piriforme]